MVMSFKDDNDSEPPGASLSGLCICICLCICECLLICAQVLACV